MGTATKAKHIQKPAANELPNQNPSFVSSAQWLTPFLRPCAGVLSRGSSSVPSCGRAEAAVVGAEGRPGRTPGHPRLSGGPASVRVAPTLQPRFRATGRSPARPRRPGTEPPHRQDGRRSAGRRPSDQNQIKLTKHSQTDRHAIRKRPAV